MKPVKASVLIVTYNHAAYIERALTSVVEQKTDFDFEIIISEDASTDGTTEIVRRFASDHPDRVRLILSETNVRSNAVVRRGFEAARGDYVALVDGDDFWTSPEKLARQVAVLDADPALSLCFTNATVVDEKGEASGRLWTPLEKDERLPLSTFWQGNPFATCGSLFRRASVPEIPQWYDGFFPVTDWPLYILFAQRGDIAYLHQPMGAYRLHSGGLFSAQDAAKKLGTMDMLFRRLEDCLDPKYRVDIRAGHNRYFLDWAKEFLNQGQTVLARQSLGHFWRHRAATGIFPRREETKLGVRMCLRRIFGT
ncbi:MAG: glycosyltransferase [Sphingobium sp.]